MMDAKQDLDLILKESHGHAVLVSALGDYIGDLEAKCESRFDDAEATCFPRSIRFAEALSDIFYRWP
ncbi:hypothetical protein PTQ19_02010 [Microbacterium esteraromaticum]|uniref:hypothetical protein n=1 Tax=Microbacterium esteraromaticum TaxID=57043 RepID=UPI0023674EC9|nr:hypothetical protein [Microbacterium esteraromaticum]WDH79246.1 hypothetical protein PTQ19_02010 [Microbacterium esteraromaticum]